MRKKTCQDIENERQEALKLLPDIIKMKAERITDRLVNVNDDKYLLSHITSFFHSISSYKTVKGDYDLFRNMCIESIRNEFHRLKQEKWGSEQNKTE